ncbi:glycosyltransferase [Corynebacterium halotolerans]|uniref:glycosyltransferase n=1 Tax=Corynebacterium halotolerans TaxID=225326 RepID=UPI003CFB4621
MKWKFRLRVFSLLASAVLRLVREDPTGFAIKVAERVRTSDSKLLSKVPRNLLSRLSLPPSEARKFIELGELSDGIKLVERQGRSANRSDRHLAQRTRERLQQLTEPIPSSANSGERPTQHRILHVLTNSVPYTHSGYTVRSHNVLKSQRDAGLAVQGVTRLAYPVLVGKLPGSPVQIINGIEYHRLLPKSYPVSLLERDELAVAMIIAQAQYFGASILHTTTDFKNAMVVAKAAQRLGIPWVYEIRGELESTWLSKQPDYLQERAVASEFYRLARRQEAACARAADAVVTLSEIVKRQFVARGVSGEDIHVIPNAIDQRDLNREFDRSAIRAELGLPDISLVGTVTSVVDYEGIDTLIRALLHLPDSVEALIVGDGTARPGLEDLVRELGLDSRVHFVGRKPQEDIWKWYATLDVFVVPRKDLQVCRVVTPIKALMAQALEVPVVASDLPALREVTGGRAEYVPPEDSHSLAAGVRKQLQVPLTNDGDADWLASRTWTANADRYLRLYESL